LDDYVLPKFFTLDRSGEGGHQAMLMGAPGEGKTTLLEYLAILAAKGKDIYGKDREKQACIWRARQHDRYLEFFKLGVGKLMLPENSNYTLLKVYEKHKEEITMDDLESLGIDYGLYTDPQSIVDQLEAGKILCILFPGSKEAETVFYSDLFESLVHRKTDEWVNVSIDESGDILAPYTAESYKVQKRFIDSIGDFRKNNIDSILGCHVHTDLDFRVRGKCKYHIYKSGATKMPGETRRLREETINHTKVSEAWITYGGFFDKFVFPDMAANAKLDYKLQTVAKTMAVQTE
jgi:hypothetical protein